MVGGTVWNVAVSSTSANLFFRFYVIATSDARVVQVSGDGGNGVFLEGAEGVFVSQTTEFRVQSYYGVLVAPVTNLAIDFNVTVLGVRAVKWDWGPFSPFIDPADPAVLSYFTLSTGPSLSNGGVLYDCDPPIVDVFFVGETNNAMSLPGGTNYIVKTLATFSGALSGVRYGWTILYSAGEPNPTTATLTAGDTVQYGVLTNVYRKSGCTLVSGATLSPTPAPTSAPTAAPTSAPTAAPNLAPIVSITLSGALSGALTADVATVAASGAQINGTLFIQQELILLGSLNVTGDVTIASGGSLVVNGGAIQAGQLVFLGVTQIVIQFPTTPTTTVVVPIATFDSFSGTAPPTTLNLQIAATTPADSCITVGAPTTVTTSSSLSAVISVQNACGSGGGLSTGAIVGIVVGVVVVGILVALIVYAIMRLQVSRVREAVRQIEMQNHLDDVANGAQLQAARTLATTY